MFFFSHNEFPMICVFIYMIIYVKEMLPVMPHGTFQCLAGGFGRIFFATDHDLQVSSLLVVGLVDVTWQWAYD